MYTSKYLKIYFWQGAAFLLRFLSLFIVTPYLTKDPSTYGIYAVCLSVTFFFSYADLGFLRAGQKYAAECYAKGERAEEMRYIGFGIFVLLGFTLLCSSAICYLGYHPQVLIKGLSAPGKISTASNLLLILAGFAPVTVLQRMAAMIFDIRLESYINQRISLFASIITISSVFYFFGGGDYRIVPYFFFSQSLNLIAVGVCLWLAKRKYGYDLKQLFKSIAFNADIYKKANGLAYSGLYVMVVWILFYELDQMAIGKFLGIEKVAIYSIAFAFATLFRSVYGILFSPFVVRANHFVGNGDEEGLKRFSLQLVSLSAPLVVLPTIALALVARPFILSWVGTNYSNSVALARLFSLIATLSFISYTASMILTAKVRLKEVYITSTIQPIIYWLGILTTYSFWGLLSFAAFKLIATVIPTIYFFCILIRFFNMSAKELLQKTVYPLVWPLMFLVTALLIANRYLPCEKSKVNLLIVLGTTGICIATSMGIQYLTSSDIRKAAKNIIGNIFPEKPITKVWPGAGIA
ncbi:MAG: polysaccharide biosynthesis protein [Elusimicrobia bacterium]|nr:polysaccharide biosynthesis protein [Elusimicrobiota bacterium]